LGLRSLDAQIAVLAQTIRARSDSLELARARLQAGLASELDVHQAQGALSDALVQQRDAERQRALLERQLGQLTGRLDLKLARGARRPGAGARAPGARGLPALDRDRVPRSFRRADQRRANRRERSGLAHAAGGGAQRARAIERALPVGLFALPRGARCAAHRERGRARLRAQPPGAPCVQRRSDEGARRRLDRSQVRQVRPAFARFAASRSRVLAVSTTKRTCFPRPHCSTGSRTENSNTTFLLSISETFI